MKSVVRLLPVSVRRWLISSYLQSRFDVQIGRAVTVNPQTTFEGMNLVITEMRGVKIEKVLLTKRKHAASAD